MIELYHHGILGMHWGIRRYQNKDGTLTEAGKRKLEKRDVKWANKNHDKIYRKAYKASKKDLNRYVKNELNVSHAKAGKRYINEYNRKMAELMSANSRNIQAPSGRVVQFVAKRGKVGVHMALADPHYDMSQFKNGVWDSGRVAYKKKMVTMAYYNTKGGD